jgi:Tol biopolymer transport system component
VIFVVNVDGSGVERLTRRRRGTGEDWSENPSWSPDGQWIAFDGARKLTNGFLIPDIYVMRADGTGERRLAGGRAYQWNPVWSPDGRTILFEQFVGNPFRESKLIDLYAITRTAAADGSWRASGTSPTIAPARSGLRMERRSRTKPRELGVGRTST